MNSSLTNLTPQQLRRAADLKEKIDALQNEITRLLGSPIGNGAGTQKKRRMSPAAIARIRAGAKARWAKIKRKESSLKSAHKPKRKISAVGRAKLAANARARWKKAKAQGKTTL